MLRSLQAIDMHIAPLESVYEPIGHSVALWALFGIVHGRIPTHSSTRFQTCLETHTGIPEGVPVQLTGRVDDDGK